MSGVIQWDDLTEEEKYAHSLRNPAALSKWLNPERQIARHVAYISERVTDSVLECMDSGVGKILVIEAPPGHAKSDTISIHTPLWFLSRWPDRKVALCAYGHDKAVEWGQENRNTIQDNQDRLVLRLRRDSKAKARWNTDEGGGMMCTGVGGPLTGFRAHFLVIDDPVKDDKEANSELIRENTWNWYTKVALTRLWPEALTVVLMTRWHEDDLIGRIKKNYEDAVEDGVPATRVEVIRLPCLCDDEENDPLERELGEPLWPEVYDAEWAERKRHDVGSRAWGAMYQQNPTEEEGAMFKREHFRYCRDVGDAYEVDGARFAKTNMRYFQTADTAMKETQQSDYTVVTTFGLTPGADLLVLHVERRRVPVPDQWELVMAQRAWARQLPGRYLWIGVEDKGSGVGLIQTARKMKVPLKALKADRDKVTRAAPASVWYESGRVYHLQNAPWCHDYEAELLSFPNGKHDDQVDTVAYAVLEMSTAKSAMATIDPDRDRGRPTRDPEFAGMVPQRLEF